LPFTFFEEKLPMLFKKKGKNNGNTKQTDIVIKRSKEAVNKKQTDIVIKRSKEAVAVDQ
jgi:hypothetical protein